MGWPFYRHPSRVGGGREESPDFISFDTYAKAGLALTLRFALFRWLLTGLLFGGLLVGGWRLAADYGSFTDESMCRDTGQVSLVYLYEWLPPALRPARAAARLAALPASYRLPTYKDRAYGVAFELPMTLVEKTSGYTNLHDVLLLRHRCVFGVCWLGLLAFYWLAARRLGSWGAGLLGVLLLVLSPRLFADAFYNAKDAVFAAAYLVATATAVALVRRPGTRLAAAHALACALAIDVRLMGLLVPVLTLALLALRAIRGDYAGRRGRVGRATALYAGLLPLLVLAFWPFLWAAPLAHFVEAFARMSHFDWVDTRLYRGRVLPAGAATPWHYPLVWIGITTPLPYLAGLVLALARLGWQLGRRGWRLYGPAGEWQDLLYWGLGLGPLVVVIGLHSALYDGWRQLYFVYPPLLLLALRGGYTK
ncbi:MAG: hypothetical protein EOO59_02465 [Hymenobacter sp.]|nr:MAG: hypothetical protein EOO59_02465 [Hymenobacter sp.]